MTDAPRYRLVGYDIGTAPDENGGWVHWTDHEAIVARLTAERADATRAKDCFQRMTRAHWEALCAMRNSINEYIQMPNTDSGPLFSPEDGPIYADIAERVIADLAESRAYALALEQELRDRAEKAEAERDEARKVIAWANNSLYGSHGFFLSLDGGPANEHHLDNGIEELKDIVRRKFSNGTAMIWHPIETAPKDGTPIDLWAGERIANCTWNAPSACWDERIGTGYGGKHWAVMSAPTHWMPLPAAPTNPEDPAHD